MTVEEVKGIIRDVKDFPVKGILFKDLTTAFKKPECLSWMKQELVREYKDKGITKILGIESRGFIIGAMTAEALGAGFVPIRKKGKLPAEIVEETYEKEYGFDTIEIHKDALDKDDIIMIHDDLLATGGTIKAAVRLAKKMGVKKIYASFLVELTDLKGKEKIDKDVEVYSLIKY